MTSFRWYFGFVALLLAASVTAQNYSNYPTLDEPIHYMESFHSDIRYREDQTQAAVLLVLFNLLSPRDRIEPQDMAPPEHLQTIGLSEELYELLGTDVRKLPIEKVRVKFDLESRDYEKLTDELVTAQRRSAERISRRPNPEDVAELATISFAHPDPLVRIASAPLVFLLTDGGNEALEELRHGTSLKDERLSLLAATLLARLYKQDPALERFAKRGPTGPRSEEEPKTTIVVHGTWASNGSWWRNGYRFFEYLEHDVPVNDLYLGTDPFSWSGDWDHDKRVQAADELTLWTTQHNESCLNSVAHSHGANVVFLASRSKPYGRMIALATPGHPHLYSPGTYTSLYSLRVRLDWVVLADGGGNRFPSSWQYLEEEYFGWFNHFSTHKASRWIDKGIPAQLPVDVCP